MEQKIKKIISRAFALEKYIRAYNGLSTESKNQAVEKFTAVWGVGLAHHFLIKYDDAESLIWALDSENLNLFIENF